MRTTPLITFYDKQKVISRAAFKGNNQSFGSTSVQKHYISLSVQKFWIINLQLRLQSRISHQELQLLVVVSDSKWLFCSLTSGGSVRSTENQRTKDLMKLSNSSVPGRPQLLHHISVCCLLQKCNLWSFNNLQGKGGWFCFTLAQYKEHYHF